MGEIYNPLTQKRLVRVNEGEPEIKTSAQDGDAPMRVSNNSQAFVDLIRDREEPDKLEQRRKRVIITVAISFSVFFVTWLVYLSVMRSANSRATEHTKIMEGSDLQVIQRRYTFVERNFCRKGQEWWFCK